VVTIELVRHPVAEEQYLYPAVREHVADRDSLADKEIADHSPVEELLKDLEQMDIDSLQMNSLLQRLIKEVNSHVQDEETHLFPKLREACSAEKLNNLGDKVRGDKEMAPTRPHASAPDTPTASKLLAPGAGLVDRARDFLVGRGKS
jgi:hemerythrin superfamily protein